MRISFRTRSGLHDDRGTCLVEVWGSPDDESPEQLLNLGWLPDPSTGQWYMSRSTRLNLGLWQPTKSQTHSYKKFEWNSRASWVNESERELLRLYRKSRSIPEYDFDCLKNLGKYQLEVGTFGEQSVWSMILIIGDVSLYPLCAYIDAGNSVSPGKACWTRACAISKKLGAKYLYAYEGYGPSGSYKCQSLGFEWWDGASWSDDAGEYQTLTQHHDIVVSERKNK